MILFLRQIGKFQINVGISDEKCSHPFSDEKCSPFSSGWVSGCHPAAGPALPFSRSEDFSALWVSEKVRLFVMWILSQRDNLKFLQSQICIAFFFFEFSKTTCSLLSSLCLCSVMSSSFSCFDPRRVRAANDVKRRDNSFEALSTTPAKESLWWF